MIQCCCGAQHVLERRGLLAMALAAAVPRHGTAAPGSAGPADPALIDDPVDANRILFEQGVVDGFDHVSGRYDKDPNRYLLARCRAPARGRPWELWKHHAEGRS